MIPTGDFIGFSFDGVHCTEMGFFRTSDGSRYNDDMIPTIQDKTVQTPDGDGMFYFNTYYTQKPFSISIAFDSMTEEQYENFRRVFNGKGVHELIFDERPYKVYHVKVTGTPQLKTICFDKEITSTAVERVYKGEGVIGFTAYYPYATTKHKFIEDYYAEGWKNIDEWAAASELPESRFFLDENGEQKQYSESFRVDEDKWEFPDSSSFTWEPLYFFNSGVEDCDFTLGINMFGRAAGDFLKIFDNFGNYLLIDAKAFHNSDGRFYLDTKNRLLFEGVHDERDDKITHNGTILNRYIVGGDFFQLKKGTKEGALTLEWYRYDNGQLVPSSDDESTLAAIKAYDFSYSPLYF